MLILWLQDQQADSKPMSHQGMLLIIADSYQFSFFVQMFMSQETYEAKESCFSCSNLFI